MIEGITVLSQTEIYKATSLCHTLMVVSLIMIIGFPILGLIIKNYKLKITCLVLCFVSCGIPLKPK